MSKLQLRSEEPGSLAVFKMSPFAPNKLDTSVYVLLKVFVLWLYCMSFGLGTATNQNVRIKAFSCISDFSLIILKIQNGNGIFTLLLYYITIVKLLNTRKQSLTFSRFARSNKEKIFLISYRDQVMLPNLVENDVILITKGRVRQRKYSWYRDD